jgi:hypothetical protein
MVVFELACNNYSIIIKWDVIFRKTIHKQLVPVNKTLAGWDSIVCIETCYVLVSIETCYGMDLPGIES